LETLVGIMDDIKQPIFCCIYKGVVCVVLTFRPNENLLLDFSLSQIKARLVVESVPLL